MQKAVLEIAQRKSNATLTLFNNEKINQRNNQQANERVKKSISKVKLQQEIKIPHRLLT
jgi:hypothetical protein